MIENECEFCGYLPEKDEYYERTPSGWFCEMCDSFNYFQNARKEIDQYLVILENKQKTNEANGKSHLNKNLSPFRYPGGKSRMIDYLYNELMKNKCETLYSPFCGGASYELAMLDGGVVKKLVINDLDYGIWSVWWTILHMPDELIYRINNIVPTHKDYFLAQKQIKAGFNGLNPIDAAWATLMVNRLAYSGISLANPLGGKQGAKEQLLSRWNPSKLIRQIQHIAKFHNQIELHCEDAFEFMVEAYWDNKGCLFIDPPYLEKGDSLYPVKFTYEQHLELSTHLNLLYSGVPGANIIVTYDYNHVTEAMFNSVSDTKIVGRRYSI